jgi:hypothetical protein
MINFPSIQKLKDMWEEYSSNKKSKVNTEKS